MCADVDDGIYVFGDMGRDCVDRHFAISAGYGLSRVSHAMPPVQPPHCLVVYGSDLCFKACRHSSSLVVSAANLISLEVIPKTHSEIKSATKNARAIIHMEKDGEVAVIQNSKSTRAATLVFCSLLVGTRGFQGIQVASAMGQSDPLVSKKLPKKLQEGSSGRHFTWHWYLPGAPEQERTRTGGCNGRWTSSQGERLTEAVMSALERAPLLNSDSSSDVSAEAYEALVDALCFADALDEEGYRFLASMTTQSRDARIEAVRDFFSKFYAQGAPAHNARYIDRRKITDSVGSLVFKDEKRGAKVSGVRSLCEMDGGGRWTYKDSGRNAILCPPRVDPNDGGVGALTAALAVLYAISYGDRTDKQPLVEQDEFISRLKSLYARAGAGAKQEEDLFDPSRIGRMRFDSEALSKTYWSIANEVGLVESISRVSIGLSEGHFLPTQLALDFDRFYRIGQNDPTRISVARQLLQDVLDALLASLGLGRQCRQSSARHQGIGLFSIPRLNSDLDERSELRSEICKRLREAEAARLGERQGSIVFLTGEGGMGKSVVAALAAEDWSGKEKSRAVIWCPFDRTIQRTLENLGRRIHEELGYDFGTGDEVYKSVIKFLEDYDKEILLVIDNAYAPGTKMATLGLTGECPPYRSLMLTRHTSTLITTRFAISRDEGYSTVEVPGITEDGSFELFNKRVQPPRIDGQRGDFEKLYRQLGANTLVLAVSAAAYKNLLELDLCESLAEFREMLDEVFGKLGEDVGDVGVEVLEEGGVAVPVRREPSQWISALFMVDGLSAAERTVLACVRLLPQEGAPAGLVSRALKDISIDDESLVKALGDLKAERLLVLEEHNGLQYIRMHDVVAAACDISDISTSNGSTENAALAFADGLWRNKDPRGASALDTQRAVEYAYSEMLESGHDFDSRKAFSEGAAGAPELLHLVARDAALLTALGKTRESRIMRSVLVRKLKETDEVASRIDWQLMRGAVLGEAEELDVRPEDIQKAISAQAEIGLAMEEGRCGDYSNAIDRCSAVLGSLDLDEGATSNTHSDIDRVWQLLAARALRTRGYLTFDRCANTGPEISEKAAGYCQSLNDKRKAMSLIERASCGAPFSGRFAGALARDRASILVTTAYSESHAGQAEKDQDKQWKYYRDALEHINEAISVYEQLPSKPDDPNARDIEIDYATAIYQAGLFEARAAQHLSKHGNGELADEKLRVALEHRVTALEKRSRLLSVTHMDTARTWISVGSSLCQEHDWAAAQLCLRCARFILQQHTKIPPATDGMLKGLEDELAKAPSDDAFTCTGYHERLSALSSRLPLE